MGVQQRSYSFSELLDALHNDFVGDEPLRQLLTNPDKTPKYGNEHPDADAIAAKVVKMLDEAFRAKRIIEAASIVSVTGP